MKHQCYNVIGVMSGTSLDAIDVIYVKLVCNKSWSFQIKAVKSIPYNDYWKNRLAGGLSLVENELTQLNEDYTVYLAQNICEFISDEKLLNVMAICSHGHTVIHQPELGRTLQIGNLPNLSKLTGCRLICDFRAQDVNLGGQGAPLVPIGDRLLFSDYDYCLNLGGFSNISYEQGNTRIAFDISPVNVILNKYALKLGKDYDDKGDFARIGKVNNRVLDQLNRLKFYKNKPPKSLGMEWVKLNVLPIISQISNEYDALATFTEHTAIQIAEVLSNKSRVLITGGGAYNTYLIERIQTFSNAELIIPDRDLVEFKEALIFAFLGVLKLRNENNCLSSVTGSSIDHSSGEIYVPKKS